MTDRPVVIRAEGIGKKYVIRHKRERLSNSKFKERPANAFKRESREDFFALKDVSFEIHRGERVGIIGKNGAGKSTLLKLLSRITEPTYGRIELTGKVSSMLEVGTGFSPELTGRENIYLNGAVLGMSKKEVDEKFEKIVDFSEIGRFLDTPVKRYSSGMYVRLAFSVASHLEPDILIIDEVLAVGDQKFRQKSLDRMKEIASNGKTVLCVSHQMNVIRDLCDRVIVLREGRIVFDGGTEEGIKFYTEDIECCGQEFFDLRESKRPNFVKVRTPAESISILNEKERAAGSDKSLKFTLRWKALDGLQKVKLRLVVRFADETNAGIALSDAICDAEKDKTYEHTFSFDTSNLFPGDYSAAITLYQSDSQGGSDYLDHVDKALTFTVYELQGRDKSVIYNHQFWGHVRLADLVVTE